MAGDKEELKQAGEELHVVQNMFRKVDVVINDFVHHTKIEIFPTSSQ